MCEIMYSLKYALQCELTEIADAYFSEYLNSIDKITTQSIKCLACNWKMYLQHHIKHALFCTFLWLMFPVHSMLKDFGHDCVVAMRHYSHSDQSHLTCIIFEQNIIGAGWQKTRLIIIKWCSWIGYFVYNIANILGAGMQLQSMVMWSNCREWHGWSPSRIPALTRTERYCSFI